MSSFPFRCHRSILGRFEISRQYKAHLDSVAADRQLEVFLQDIG